VGILLDVIGGVEIALWQGINYKNQDALAGVPNDHG
jgi:hypothetical protein